MIGKLYHERKYSDLPRVNPVDSLAEEVEYGCAEDLKRRDLTEEGSLELLTLITSS